MSIIESLRERLGLVVISVMFVMLLSFPSFTFPPVANAQYFGETLDLTISPKHPTPGARVHVTVKSVSKDLNNLNIIWTLDGDVVKQGIGEKSFDFVAGRLGSRSSLVVSAGGLSKGLDIRPTEVDVVWETDGYVPPFYKGKVLRTYQGSIRLVAIPHFLTPQGTHMDPKKLVYNWYNGGVINAAASGYGRNSLSYSGSVISRPLNISVEVSSPDGVYMGVGRVVVEETDPAVRLYEDHPLYGVLYNRALDGAVFDLAKEEVRVTAAPYFFTISQKNDRKLDYSWSINNIPSQNPAFNDSVVFRREPGLSGVSNISLSIENSKEFLQSARGTFQIRFNSQNENI